MQGPKLKIITDCQECTFVGKTGICKKLNISLEVRNGLIQPDKNCPFLEENSIQFHNESLFKLHEDREENLKKKMQKIFCDFQLKKLTVNEILISTEKINDEHILKIQEEFSDYSYEIYVDDNINLKLALTKKITK